MKEFIRDNNKIRDCIANRAKMNVFEYGWHFGIKKIFRSSCRTFYDFIETIWKLAIIVFGFLLILTSPLWIWIKWYLEIKDARQEVRREEERKARTEKDA